MKQVLSLIFVIAAFSSCMKKMPIVSYYGIVKSPHGYILKNTDVICITNMNSSETSRRICKTDSFGMFLFDAEFRTKKIKVGIECVTDSGSFRAYNLDKAAISALSHTITLQP